MTERRRRGRDDDDMLDQLRRRIGTLGLLHQQLTRGDDLTSLDAAPFLAELGARLQAAAVAGRPGPRVEVECMKLPVDLDVATGLGLLVTELVCEALHRAAAGAPEAGGTVHVRLRRAAGGGLSLTVSDGAAAGGAAANGDGGGWDEAAPGEAAAAGAGATIVAAMVRQLGGRMRLRRGAVSTVEIRIPAAEEAPGRARAR
jgi:two-component sensor histidine kinase